MAVPQVREDEIPRRFPARITKVERGGDGHWNENGIGHVGQRNERRAISELRAQLGGEMKREPGLAGASRAGQRQQSRGLLIPTRLAIPRRREPKRGAGRGDLPLASDEWRGRMRHVVQVTLRRAQGWEVGGKSGSDDLVDVFRVEQILERVRPEIAQGDAGWEAVAGELAGGPRDDDLLAVRGRQQPGDTVERRTEVVTGAPFRLAGVNRHADFQRDVLRSAVRR